MKKNVALFTMIFAAAVFVSSSLHAEPTIVGVWKTLADEGKHKGKVSSHIEIYEKNGKYFGKIVKLLLDPPDEKCDKCTGAKKDQPVLGMVILEGMQKVGDHFEGGKIMDPENGKYYTCKIWIEGDNKLKVRGYVLFFFRTQYWYRLK